MKKLAFLILAIFFSHCVPARAQLQNMILLEEATNASCGPCAQENPILAQFLQENTDAVIAVSYHAWWPGSTDPMYTNDIPMNTNRIYYDSFYNIGVRVCVVNGHFAVPTNGWYTGAPGDTDALTNAVSAAKQVTSPYTMTVNRFAQNDSEEVQVIVNSSTAVTNDTLRVIIVEAEHDYTNAGTNGETRFFHIAREMLPSYEGTGFSLPANGSASFIFKYEYDPDWNTDQLSVIAFVQSSQTVRGAVQTVDAPQSGFLSVPTAASEQSGISMRVAGNPLETARTIDYMLEGDGSNGEFSNVTFSIVDLLGREVQALGPQPATPGEHALNLMTANLPSGAYRVIAQMATGIMQVPFVIEH